MKTLLLIAVSIIVISAGASGCGLAGKNCDDCAEVLAAEDRVTIEERDYILEASLWVNLMPPVPSEGPDLNLIAKITAVDGNDFPESYGAEYGWILQNDIVTLVEFTEERPRELSGNNILEKIATTKEEFNSDIPVDIVVLIVDSEGDKYYVRAREIPITVTH